MNDEPRINLGSITCINMINGVGTADKSQPDYAMCTSRKFVSVFNKNSLMCVA